MRNYVVVCFLLMNIAATAGLVRWDNLEFYKDTPMGEPGETTYDFNVYQDESAMDNTEMLFNYNPDNSTITYANMSVDEGSEWYFVSPGDLINSVQLDNGVYQSFTDPPFGGDHDPVVIGTTFYMALRTYQEHTGWHGSDVFGWVELQQTPQGLEMHSNAMAYEAASLTVGSYNFVPVPEPATWMLFCSGFVVLSLLRCRRKILSV